MAQYVICDSIGSELSEKESEKSCWLRMTRGNQRDRDRARAQARAAKRGTKSSGATSGSILAKNARYVTLYFFFFP